MKNNNVIKMFSGSTTQLLETTINDWVKENSDHIEIIGREMTYNPDMEIYVVMMAYKEVPISL